MRSRQIRDCVCNRLRDRSPPPTGDALATAVRQSPPRLFSFFSSFAVAPAAVTAATIPGHAATRATVATVSATPMPSVSPLVALSVSLRPTPSTPLFPSFSV